MTTQSASIGTMLKAGSVLIGDPAGESAGPALRSGRIVEAS